MTSSALTLWIPNLLTSAHLVEAKVGLDEKRFPALETLLAKANRLPKESMHRNSFAGNASYLFHQKAALPVAPTTAIADLEDFDPAYFWLRVDPVHFIPDRDTLILIPGEGLRLEDGEAKALVEAFNQHFEQDRVVLEMGSNLHWYIRILQPIDVQTHSLEAVSYQSIQDAMPEGNAATYWRQLMNEVQMLFFTHPVNEARRSKGLPEVNGVWVWGEGQVSSEAVYARKDAVLAGGTSYLKGVAKLSQSSFMDVPDSYPTWQKLVADKMSNEHMVVLEDAMLDMTEQNWLILLEQLEENWFTPILSALRNGSIHSLLLDLGMNHRYYLTPSHLKKFWRWKKPIQKYAN